MTLYWRTITFTVGEGRISKRLSDLAKIIPKTATVRSPLLCLNPKPFLLFILLPQNINGLLVLIFRKLDRS